MATKEEARRELARRELARRRGQPPQAGAIGDSFSSFAAGVGRGAADLVGLPGTIADFAQGGLQWGMQQGYGLATGEQPDPNSESGVERFFAGPTQEVQDSLAFGGQNPMSGDMLRSGLSTVTGGATDYQPSTTAGEYARTVGEFLPGALTLGGGGVANALRYGVAPALASETAGQATEGTAFEPYARIAGALAGGAIGSRVGQASPTKLPSAKDIKQSAGYDQLDGPMRAARLSGGSYKNIVKDLVDEAQNFGLTTDLRRQFGGTLADFHKRAQGSGGASLHDLELLRRSLRNAAGNTLDKSSQALSARLIEKLDDAVDGLSAANIAAGNQTGRPVIDALKEAREVYRTGSKAQLVEDAMTKAQSQASGVENGLRIQFRRILDNPKLRRNFNKTEIDAIEQVAKGNFTTNALRWLGSFGLPIDQGRSALGSLMGGGVGASIGSAVGGPVGAAIGAPLLMGVGTAARMGANSATRNAASVAEALVKSGPSGAKTFQNALSVSQGARREALLRALLQSQIAAQVPGSRELAR